jgi:hypothetical protein
MPDIETREHEVNPDQEEDVIVKMGRFRLYFQNYYTIVSLANDILTGSLYLTGSILQLYFDMNFLGMNLFIFASILLLMRPILKILHNVHIYNRQEFRKEVLNEDVDEEESDMKAEEGDPNKDTKEVEVKKDKQEEKDKEAVEEKQENEGDSKSDKEEKDSKKQSGWKDEDGEKEFEREYNEDYYGES